MDKMNKGKIVINGIGEFAQFNTRMGCFESDMDVRLTLRQPAKLDVIKVPDDICLPVEITIIFEWKNGET
jgi:hypothetical protein